MLLRMVYTVILRIMVTNKSKAYIVIVHTLAVALFADIRSVNWALVHGGFLSEGIMNTFYPLVIGVIISSAFLLSGKIFSRKGNSYAYYVISYIVFSYLFTLFFLGTPRISLSMFFALTVFAFLIPLFCHIDARFFVKAIMFYPFFAVFRMDSIFEMTTDWQNFMNMDASYSFLVPVIANIVYLFFYFKEESFKGKELPLSHLTYVVRCTIKASATSS